MVDRLTSDTAREKAYVRTIERRFNALRESGLYISPRDFALLLDWHERGVPAELVIQAIEEVFRKAAARGGTNRISTITYCRRGVEKAWEERRAAMLGGDPPPAGRGRGAFTREEIAAHLEASAAATEEAARAVGSAAEPDGAAGESGLARARAELSSISARLRELRAALERSPAPDLQSLETDLVALEERAVSAAKKTVSPARIEALTRAAEDSLAAFAARMSEKARSATLRRALESSLRSQLGLPRYSLFTMTR